MGPGSLRPAIAIELTRTMRSAAVVIPARTTGSARTAHSFGAVRPGRTMLGVELIPFRTGNRSVAIGVDVFKGRRSHGAARTHALATTLRPLPSGLPLAILGSFSMGTRHVALAGPMTVTRAVWSTRSLWALELTARGWGTLAIIIAARPLRSAKLIPRRRRSLKLVRIRRRWRRPGIDRLRIVGWRLRRLCLRRDGQQAHQGQCRYPGEQVVQHSCRCHKTTLLNPVRVR